VRVGASKEKEIANEKTSARGTEDFMGFKDAKIEFMHLPCEKFFDIISNTLRRPFF